MIKNRLQSLSYHNEQVEKLLTYKAGAIASYIVGPIFFVILLAGQVPNKFLIVWLLLQIMLFFIRHFYSNKLSESLPLNNTQEIREYLKILLITVAFNGFLWGLISLPTILYTSEMYNYFLLAILLGLIAGAISTLITVFHAIFFYITTILLTYLLVLLIYGDSLFAYMLDILLLFYLFVSIPASFRIYNTMAKNIQQNKEILHLNDTLETKIKEATRDLENAQKLAKIGSWSLDINNQKLIWSDETYNIFDMVKRKDRELEFKDFLSGIYEYDGLAFIESYNKHLEEKKEYNLIHRITTRQKNIKWVEERCETTYDKDGHPLLSIGTIQDITDKKNKEIALKEQEKLLQQQSRLAQMGEMISMIAHQWRQPLAAISSTSLGLNIKAKRGKVDAEMIEKKTSDIIEYSQHLSSTIDDFRDFFKPNKERREANYTELIKSVLSIVGSSLLNKNIQLIEDLTCEERFNTYPNELKQVILNLIKNAEDVLLEKNIQEPSIQIKTYKRKNKYILEVYDNAGGIPLDIIDKIFDPYFSTKNKKNGTGLGLYMSKTIVEDHCGGKLNVTNKENGASFKIILQSDVKYLDEI